MTNRETVKEVVVPITYSIRAWHGISGDQFDWVNNRGDESDELFDSIEEAERDFS